jgi:hypothetical protein
MPYIVVENFSGGLDTRRHVLNSKPGTLAVLTNAHVTRGGEIEKRKAFKPYATLPSNWGGNLEKTVGLEATGDGLVVFGSSAPPVMPAGLPISVMYQRLQHPWINDSIIADWELWDRWSTVYGGKTFVLMSFVGDENVAFYDGQAIEDWYEGLVRVNGIIGAPDNLVEDFDVTGYTAAISVVNPTTVEVTGPPGKDFTLTGSFTGTMTSSMPTITKTQDSVSAIDEVLSSGGFSISGGSESPAMCDEPGKWLRNINPATLPDIRGIYVNGIEVTGVTSAMRYDDFAEPNGETNNAKQLGSTLATYINANTSVSKIKARYNWGGNVGYSTLSPGTLFIEASNDEGADANGWEVWIEFSSDPNTTAYVSELINTSTTVASPYNPGRYISRFGIMSGGAINAVNSIKVDGVEVLGSPVRWESSDSSTMESLASKINDYASTPEYTASVENAKLVIRAIAGTGASPNGRTLSVTSAGNVVISNLTNMAGGKAAVAGVSKKYEIAFFTWADGDTFSITITDPDDPSIPTIVGKSRVTNQPGICSITYKSKEYVAAGSTLFFSAVNDATKWDIYDTGSGFIDMSNNFGGREKLTGIGIYQDRLAVFSRRNIQLWYMDPDPAKNAQYQILSNTGCIAPDSVASMGFIDTLYLSDSGIRSIRARENTDTATTNDIGSAIDDIVTAHIASLNEPSTGWGSPKGSKSKAIIDPIDGRYWLVIKNKIYVLSYYPNANISAWSVYEPGFDIDEIVTADGKIFLRSGNQIYSYGAALAFDQEDYDDCEVTVELPYLDGNKPATYKRAVGIDMTCEGEWKVYMGFDHTNPTARDLVATVNQSTYALGKIPAVGAGTHFGLRFTSEFDGYAKLANIIVHFSEMHSKHDAG